jgi:hypothetical protein
MYYTTSTPVIHTVKASSRSLTKKNTFSYTDVKVQKKRVTQRTPSPTKEYRKVELSETDIRRYFNCPQPVAALLLGVSLSSLKRRYYEIAKKTSQGQQCKRWPYQSLTMMERKQSVYYVLNSREPDHTTTLDPETVSALEKAFTNKCN